MGGFPAGERVVGPEARVQHARDVAWGLLNRRDRTEAELRRVLADKRVEPSDADLVLGELRGGGYVDDARYARTFAEDRRRLDAWGADRIERKLRSLGIDAEDVEAALAEQDEGSEFDAAVALLARRFPELGPGGPEVTAKARDRALGVLVRKGYGLELAYDALRRHAGADPVD